jgi:hypothetical protein
MVVIQADVMPQKMSFTEFVCIQLFGPSVNRQWHCPFCDPNKVELRSFSVLKPNRYNKSKWKCWRCGRWGDSADLVDRRDISPTAQRVLLDRWRKEFKLAEPYLVFARS